MSFSRHQGILSTSNYFLFILAPSGEVKPSIEVAAKIAEALEVSLDYLTGLSDLELDKNIVELITDLQTLNSEDKQHIFTTINALVRDAKARNTYK